MKAAARRPGRGGFAIGLVVGVLLGLAIALGVALYVSKVPVPFVNKVPQRTAEQDAQEAERNRNWDPNAPLAGKAGPRPPSAAAPPAAVPPPAPGAVPSPPQAAAAPPGRATSAAPPAAGGTAMIYFAQAGAYTRSDDAEAQRAKLALLGLDAKISEREQAGRTVYRVRVGPFDSKAEADGAIERLQSAGVDSALVRVQRQ